MFEQSLLQVDARESKQRKFTTFASLSLQAMMIGVLLLVPLLAPQVMPSFLQAPGTPVIFTTPPIGDVVRSSAATNPSPSAIFVENVRAFTAPRNIPSTISAADDAATGPPNIASSVFASNNYVLTNIVPNVVVKPAVTAGPMHISHLDDGALIRRVEPVYPVIAVQNRIQGTVTLDAVISKEGTIENLRVVSGSPLLTQAAIDAVKQWRYRPYILNGSPIEVETHVTVRFYMN